VRYDSSDPAVIERELSETRARLDAHLDELTSRLSPGQLVDQGLDYLRHGQGAQFARNLGRELRDNPLPVALTGLGIVWLMAKSALSSNVRPRSSPTWDRASGAAGQVYDIAERAQRAGDSLTRFPDEAEDAFMARVVEARARILGLQQDASETMAVFAERVQQALESAQQTARERLAQIGETASEWGSAVADQTRRTSEAMGQAAQQGRDMAARATTAFTQTLNENPMLLGAIGLTAGVLLAALVPPTETEEELIAPVGNAIRDAADETIERGKRAATAAAETAYENLVKP
jgi:hypothetical protein